MKIRAGQMMENNVQSAENTDLDRLFRWQDQALDAWASSQGRGIVEAMTGTGKTVLAIKAVKRLLARGERVSPLIVVPTIALLNQWCAQLRNDFPDCPIGRIGDGSSGSFARGEGGALPLVCVSTIHSAVPAVEHGLFAHCRSAGHKSFLIADECHRYLNEDQKLFHRTQTETVWLCRDSDRPLWLCRLKGQRPWFFGSTAEILMTAIEEAYGRNAGHRIETIMPLASGQPHAVTPSGLMIAPFAAPVRYRRLAD